MKSNGLLKWLTLPAVGLAIIVGIKIFSGHSTATRIADDDRGTAQLTREESKALRVEGDTPRDTVATLVGQVKELRGELKASFDDNAKQKTENDRLRQRESAVDQRIQEALSAEREQARKERDDAAHAQQDTQTLLQELKRRVDAASKPGANAELPIGLGLDDGEDSDAVFHRSSRPGADARKLSGVRWIEPQDAVQANDKPKKAPSIRADSTSDMRFPTPFGEATADHSGAPSAAGDSLVDAALPALAATPVFTVPANSTLVGSIAMTALVGRVPIDGTVNDPFPFKVIIGPDNLTANGIDLPEVAGAVMSGTASGDWTFSCVRGQIRSMTFVFNDGTIRTIPETSARNRGTSEGSRSTGAELGWISDPYGNPCVPGQSHSNAKQYLGSQMLITAAGAGAASLIDSTSSNVSYVGSNGATLGTVGITGNEAMGRILAGGVTDMSQWISKLYGQAFAAVYVPPGAPVAVHIDQPLEIDYAPHGRQVNHQTGDPHVSSTLD